MLKDKVFFLFIYTILWPLRFFSHRFLHGLGKILGSFTFYTMTSYRKRALSNLSLAKDLHLTPIQIRKIAKESFQNLVTTCLEYSKFAFKKDLSSSVICENPEIALDLIAKKQGIVFFCGHQSNWEVLFLDGTQRMPGVAIGRPIKNLFLYSWITSIREKFGGKMVTPHQAMREGFRALKQGKFLGIVGDQGMPESGFLSTFLGRKAWTSPSPAILAYRAKCPIIVATTRRDNGKYFIHYSDPIWPDLAKSLEEETTSIMTTTLKLFEDSIHKNPGEWLWQHNRWKQETPKTVYYRYRYDSIFIILPKEGSALAYLLPSIKTFREIYPQAFLTFALPNTASLPIMQNIETMYYEKEEELFVEDYRYKLVFNFTSLPKLKRHFLKQSAFKVLSLDDLKKAAPEKEYCFSELLKRALCRPNTLWKIENAS